MFFNVFYGTVSWCINKKSKNISVCANYIDHLTENIKEFKTHMRLEKTARANKNILFAGDYNLNCLDYKSNSKVRNIFDLFFLSLLINKRTRI